MIATLRLLTIATLSFALLHVNAQPVIDMIMVWTSDGHRVVEQHEVNSNSSSFTLPAGNRIYFMMVSMKGGKTYTEKIGIH
jgi:hypothetical protein